MDESTLWKKLKMLWDSGNSQSPHQLHGVAIHGVASDLWLRVESLLHQQAMLYVYIQGILVYNLRNHGNDMSIFYTQILN